MRLLLASDLHRSLRAARSLVERSSDFDVVIVAGDLATTRRGLTPVVEALSEITTPTVLVCGNSESAGELRAACEAWPAARVLPGASTTIEGVPFFGLGGAVPLTPFGSWSFDLDETTAAELLAPLEPDSVLVTHSPPLGHCDRDTNGRSLGSRSVLDAIVNTSPLLVVCGHIHESWGETSTVHRTTIINAGPTGLAFDLDDGDASG